MSIRLGHLAVRNWQIRHPLPQIPGWFVHRLPLMTGTCPPIFDCYTCLVRNASRGLFQPVFAAATRSTPGRVRLLSEHLHDDAFMINRLFALFQRPDRGFDPVPADYAERYAMRNYDIFDPSVVDEVERFAGTVSGRSILDLGAGPGQYSVEFARRGGRVTWFDISARYREFARQHAKNQQVELQYELDYIDHARGQYDIVFNRICWYYCFDDRAFARRIHTLVKPGGYGYLVLHHEDAKPRRKDSFIRGLFRRVQLFSNERLGIKIGHPSPTLKKIHRIFGQLAFESLEIDPRSDHVYILFRKPVDES